MDNINRKNMSFQVTVKEAQEIRSYCFAKEMRQSEMYRLAIREYIKEHPIERK